MSIIAAPELYMKSLGRIFGAATTDGRIFILVWKICCPPTSGSSLYNGAALVACIIRRWLSLTLKIQIL
jgi:hypothetical protein